MTWFLHMSQMNLNEACMSRSLRMRYCFFSGVVGMCVSHIGGGGHVCATYAIWSRRSVPARLAFILPGSWTKNSFGFVCFPCDMTPSHVTWLIHMWHGAFIWDLTHSPESWHDSWLWWSPPFPLKSCYMWMSQMNLNEACMSQSLQLTQEEFLSFLGRRHFFLSWVIGMSHMIHGHVTYDSIKWRSPHSKLFEWGISSLERVGPTNYVCYFLLLNRYWSRLAATFEHQGGGVIVSRKCNAWKDCNVVEHCERQRIRPVESPIPAWLALSIRP